MCYSAWPSPAHMNGSTDVLIYLLSQLQYIKQQLHDHQSLKSLNQSEHNRTVNLY